MLEIFYTIISTAKVGNLPINTFSKGNIKIVSKNLVYYVGIHYNVKIQSHKIKVRSHPKENFLKLMNTDFHMKDFLMRIKSLLVKVD